MFLFSILPILSQSALREFKMNVSQINNVGFGKASMLAKVPKFIARDSLMKEQNIEINKNLLINRSKLQKVSPLKNLNYDDYFNDIHYNEPSDHEFFADYLGGRDREKEARGVVVGMTIANTFVGGAAAQLPVADIAACASVVGVMCTKIATIYDVKLTYAVMDAIKQSFGASLLAGLSVKTVTWIPLIGNVVNAVATGAITKTVGDRLVDKFETAMKKAQEEFDRNEKLKNIIDENEKLKKRNELINEILAEIAEEERKRNNS